MTNNDIFDELFELYQSGDESSTLVILSDFETCREFADTFLMSAGLNSTTQKIKGPLKELIKFESSSNTVFYFTPVDLIRQGNLIGMKFDKIFISEGGVYKLSCFDYLKIVSLYKEGVGAE